MCYGSIEEIADVSFNEVLGPNKPQGRTRFYENLTHPVSKISYTQRRPRKEYSLTYKERQLCLYNCVRVWREKIFKYLRFHKPHIKKTLSPVILTFSANKTRTPFGVIRSVVMVRLRGTCIVFICGNWLSNGVLSTLRADFHGDGLDEL